MLSMPLILSKIAAAQENGNSGAYRSLKQYGKEQIAEEKGSAMRGLLYAIPAAVAGGLAGYHLGPKAIPLAKKMPMFMQKGMRKAMDKADLGKRFTMESMNHPFWEKLLQSTPKEERNEVREELFNYVKGGLSNPALKTGIAGAAVGGTIGAQAGAFKGGLKGVREAEQDSGFAPSTKAQHLGRTTGEIGGSIVGTLAGIATGKQLMKILPKATGNTRSARAFNLGRNAVGYVLPAYLMEQAGQMAGGYGVSRYLQKHHTMDAGATK